jgi:hypothetical protein
MTTTLVNHRKVRTPVRGPDIQEELEEAKLQAEIHMQIIDRWPPEWRAVVYEIGFARAYRLKEDGYTPEEALDW